MWEQEGKYCDPISKQFKEKRVDFFFKSFHIAPDEQTDQTVNDSHYQTNQDIQEITDPACSLQQVN